MAKPSVIAIYGNRRMTALLALGFGSGLPSAYMLLGSTMQAWLGAYRVDIEQIGYFSLIGIPFAFNFLWAPLLDRFAPPPGFVRLGRRRGWLLLVQLLLLAAIAAMAISGPTHVEADLTFFAITALVVATLAATQDVLADAYRTDVLPHEELGAGAAVFVNGYRIAMLAAGGGALLLVEPLGWRNVYLLLAILMGVGVVGTLTAPRPQQAPPPTTLARAVVEPLRDFLARHREAAVILILFVVLFKLPDTLARVMVTPLLQTHLSFDLEEIAWVQAWLGLAMAMIGAMIGGTMVARMGLWGSLWLAGALQMLSNFGFTALAMRGHDLMLLAAVVSIEGLCGGLVTAAFIAFLMSQCNRRFSATQYALFTSLNYFTGVITGALSGLAVKQIGFTWYFTATVAAGIPGLMMLALLGKSRVTADARFQPSDV